MRTFVSLAMAITAIAFTLTATVIAQEIPVGPYSAEASFSDDGKLSTVHIVWYEEGSTPLEENPSRTVLLAEFREGKLTTIAVTVVRQGATVYYEDPTPKESERTQPLKYPEVWEVFASGIGDRFRIFGRGLVVDLAPAKVLAISSIPEGFESEYELQAIVLQQKGQYLSIPITRWVGKAPKVGEEILLGRQKLIGSQFFQVYKSGGKYTLEPETADGLARERAAHAREVERSPVIIEKK